MKALYVLAYKHHPDTWIHKKDLYSLIADNQEPDKRLAWFGNLLGDDSRKARTSLGIIISQFKNRILADIRLEIDLSQQHSERWRIRFIKPLQ
jgi:hypothetical protein